VCVCVYVKKKRKKRIKRETKERKRKDFRGMASSVCRCYGTRRSIGH
jgi:hypothetical protein